MMSSRRSGIRGEGSGARGQHSAFSIQHSAFRLCPLLPAGRLPNAAVWLMALLGSLVLASVCRAEDSAAERRQRIENMKPAEKKQLLQHQGEFLALEKQERQRLRQLQRDVENDPDADKLRLVMHAYCEWLKTLPAHTHAELLDLEPAKRIERIKQLRAEEEKELSPKDLEGLLGWLRDYAANPKHQAEILQTATEEERQRFQARTPAERAWVAAEILREETFRPVPSEWQGWPGYLDRPRWLTDEELAKLRNHLSARTAKRLAKMTPLAQFNAINGWYENSTGHSFSGRRFRVGPPPKEFQEQLDQFFQKELTEEQQNELLSLPGDEMQRELRRMYFWRSGLVQGPMRGRRAGPPDSQAGSPPPEPEQDAPAHDQ
jgi:hypothetical protein